MATTVKTIDQVLNDTFGYSSFRPHQREIIEHIVDDCVGSQEAPNGTLVVMPTGGGKSLIYQIPALLGPGLSIVVSPLISLMKDQVDSLRARGVRADCVNSSMSQAELLAVRSAVIAGEIDLLYVAPERFKNDKFMSVVTQQNINVMAIDEAHCISHWGSGFRPSYRFIKRAMEALKPQRVVALTATANAETRKDIIENLGLPNAKTFVTGFNRDDLTWGLTRMHGDVVESAREAVLDCYDPDEGMGCGLVYMVTKKNCEALVEELKRFGIPCQFYHADLADGTKTSVQEEWMANDGVIVATTAFGMGIDKPNVRFVINGGLPSNVEEWYQMIGRGSRDGEGCECYLFSDAEDLRIKYFMIDSQFPEVAHVMKFKQWIDVQTRGGPITREITQTDMAIEAGVPNNVASGCCAFLAKLGAVEKVKAGQWRLIPSSSLDMDFTEHKRRIQEKKADIERVRSIAGSKDVIGEMCKYLSEN